MPAGQRVNWGRGFFTVKDLAGERQGSPRHLSGVGWNSPAPWGAGRRQGFVLASEMLRQVWDLVVPSWDTPRARTLHWLLPWLSGGRQCLAEPSVCPCPFWGASPGTAIRAAPALSPRGRDTLSFPLPCLPRALLGFKNILSQTPSKDTNLLFCWFNS